MSTVRATRGRRYATVFTAVSGALLVGTCVSSTAASAAVPAAPPARSTHDTTSAGAPVLPSVVRTVDVHSFGAVGDGVADDYAALKRVTDSLDGSPTTILLAGTFRIGGGAGRGAGLTIEHSNVRLVWAPGAKLIMDNLAADGTGTGHGILVRGNVQNIDLGGPDVEWAHLPSARSFGDGIRIEGGAAISPNTVPRNIELGSPVVRRAPQTGVVAYGAGAIFFDTIRVEDTLADGVHFNANYVGPVGGAVIAVNTGDDALAFVTYYDIADPAALSTYGDGAAPFNSPDLTTRNNRGARVGSVTSTGGGPGNALRVSGGYDISVGTVTSTGRDAAVEVDSTIQGGDIALTTLASRSVHIGSIASTSDDIALQVEAHNVPDWRTQDKFGRFGVHVDAVTSSHESSFSMLVESAQGVTVDKLVAAGEVRLRNFGNVSLGTVRTTGLLNVIGDSEGCSPGQAVGPSVHNLRIYNATVQQAHFSCVRKVRINNGLRIVDPPTTGGYLLDVADFAGSIAVVRPNQSDSDQTWQQFGYSFFRVSDSTVALSVSTDGKMPARSFEVSGGDAVTPAATRLTLTGWYRNPTGAGTADASVQNWSGGSPVNSVINIVCR